MKKKLGLLAFSVMACRVLIGSPAPAQPGTARAEVEIIVLVPVNAEIFFDGQSTKQKGRSASMSHRRSW
jgi:hypothetical protein